MNIYWINAEALWPVCNAGAVVIAKTPERALELVPELYNPQTPEKIGTTTDKKERVVVSNDGNY